MKFVKWLVRKSRALTMTRQDDELNEFIEEVTDGAYDLSWCEVILNLVKQIQAWGDDALKKKTMDKTLEDTSKSSINTKLPTCDDKGVFTDDDDTYRKHK